MMHNGEERGVRHIAFELLTYRTLYSSVVKHPFLRSVMRMSKAGFSTGEACMMWERYVA